MSLIKTPDPPKEKTLIIVDYQISFKTPGSEEACKNIAKLLRNSEWDNIIQPMWFGSGTSNFTDMVDYHECQLGDKDSEISKLFPQAVVLPRVNKYSAVTDQMVALLSHNMEIYVCGLETDACVLATCFSLFDWDVKFKVIEDCVGSKSIEADEGARIIMLRNFGKDVFIKSEELYKPGIISKFKDFLGI